MRETQQQIAAEREREKAQAKADQEAKEKANDEYLAASRKAK